MDLQQFIQSFPRHWRGEVRKQLAEKLGRSDVAVKKYISGERRVPPELYPEIEEFTKRQVTFNDLVKMAQKAKSDKTVNQ